MAKPNTGCMLVSTPPYNSLKLTRRAGPSVVLVLPANLP